MSSSGSSRHAETQGSSLAFVKPMPKRENGASHGRDSSLELVPIGTQAASAVELWSQLQPPSKSGVQQRALTRACRLGHFQVEEQIGRGGMGAVFRAVDTRLDRLVALKVLSPVQSSDHSSIERFRNEARAAARMDHENIARVYFVGEDQGLPYIAFEFVHGVNVRELIEQQGTLAPADAVNYALQVASALRHTDAAGVVHRDIKPSNIIITPLGRAKLVDLGLARKRDPQASEELTVDGTTLGTFDYISPEQAKDPRNVDVRSDIYSLGCTLYHMLAGEPPYPVGTMLQKLLDHQGKDIPDAAAANPRVPPELSAVVRKMMASDPRERYGTPDALIDDLSPIAHRFGLRPVPADGVVWRQPRAPEGWDLWKQYGGWIITAAMLLVAVFVIDRAQRPSVDREAQVALLPPSETDFSVNAPSATGEAGDADSPGPVDGIEDGADAKTTDPAANLPEAIARDAEGAGHDDIESGRSSNPLTDALRGTPGDAFPVQSISDYISSLAAPPGETGAQSGGNVPPGGLESAPATAKAEGPTPALPDVPPSPPDASENPFVLVVNRVPQGAYPTLEAACAAAPDNAVIELQFHGDQEAAQPPVKIVGKQLRIRAAKDYRPTLRFAVPDQYLSAGRHEIIRMISVSRGSLDLDNIDVKLQVESSANVGQWVLLSLVDTKRLELHGVSVTLENPSLRPAGLIERVESGRAPYSDAALDVVRIVATDCFFRGEADLLVDSTIDPADIRFNNVAVAIDGTILRMEGTDTYDMLSDMNREHNVELELKHVTALLSAGLAHFDVQSNHSVPRLIVNAGDSVISTTSGPLITMQGELDEHDFRDRLSWSGDATFLYGPDPVWQISGKDSRRDYDRSEFSGLWSSGGRRPVTGTGDGLIRSRSGWPFSKLSREDLQLDASLPVNPAINGASDLTNAGVDWDEPRLPRFTNGP